MTTDDQLPSGPEWADALDTLETLEGWSWKVYVVGDDHSRPDALVAVQQFALVADVIVFRSHGRVAGYRTITAGISGRQPALDAGQVIWHYLGDAGPLLNAILHLRLDVHCGSPYPMPDACRVNGIGWPITIGGSR